VFGRVNSRESRKRHPCAERPESDGPQYAQKAARELSGSRERQRSTPAKDPDRSVLRNRGKRETLPHSMIPLLRLSILNNPKAGLAR
jgi:hypothetical protein